MKGLFIIFMWASLTVQTSTETPITNAKFDKQTCSCKGIPLYGKVRVVDNFADFQVQVVETFPDLEVQKTNFPDECGEWEFVETFGDFTIQYVETFPDFTIRFKN